MKKMNEFNNKKNNAGRMASKESLALILNPTPKSINIARPKEETNKILWEIKPTIKPAAPINSKIAVRFPAFSSPNLLNSFFIFVDLK